TERIARFASFRSRFAHFGLTGEGGLINHYFDAFPRFFLYDDVVRTLDRLSRRYRLAVVSNIDDDFLAFTPLQREFDLVCTAQRAKGYKADGALFRYLIEHAGCEIGKARLHLGIGEARVDFLVELIDDLSGCALGSANAVPPDCLVAHHKLTHG